MNASAGGKEGQVRASASSAALGDFIVLNEEIAALTRARLPLESHLAQLGAELPGAAGDLTQRIGRRLEGGDNLAAAMDAECGDMPAVYRAVVVAGVESGQLAGAVESLSETASRLDQMRRVTGLALLYPLIVAVLACLLFGMMLVTLVPNFEWLYRRHFGPFAAVARSATAIELIAYGLPAVIVLVAVIWWWRSGRLHGAASTRLGALSRLPWTRGAHRAGQAAALADLLRMLVERGVPLDKSLRLAGDAVESQQLRTAAHALADDVSRGEAVRPASGAAPDPRFAGFPALVRLALRHTADRRLLTSSLAQAATIYRDRAARAVEWHAEFLPILLTIAIAGTLTVGFALLVFWPYASMLYELSAPNWK